MKKVYFVLIAVLILLFVPMSVSASEIVSGGDIVSSGDAGFQWTPYYDSSISPASTSTASLGVCYTTRTASSSGWNYDYAAMSADRTYSFPGKNISVCVVNPSSMNAYPPSAWSHDAASIGKLTSTSGTVTVGFIYSGSGPLYGVLKDFSGVQSSSVKTFSSGDHVCTFEISSGGASCLNFWNNFSSGDCTFSFYYVRLKLSDGTGYTIGSLPDPGPDPEPEPDPEPDIEVPEGLDSFYPYDFASSSVGYPFVVYESEPYDTDIVHFDILFNSYVRFLPHPDTKRLFAMIGGLNISWSAVNFANADYSLSVAPYVLISGKKYYISGKNSTDGFFMAGRGSPFELPFIAAEDVEYTAQIGMDVYVSYARKNDSEALKYVSGSFLFTLNSAIFSVCCSSSSPDFNIVTSVNVATSDLQNTLQSGFASSSAAIVGSVSSGFSDLQDTLQQGFDSSTTSNIQTGISDYEKIEDQLYGAAMDEISNIDFNLGSLESLGFGFMTAVTWVSSQLQTLFTLTDFSVIFNIRVTLLLVCIVLGIHRFWKGGGSND